MYSAPGLRRPREHLQFHQQGHELQEYDNTYEPLHASTSQFRGIDTESALVSLSQKDYESIDFTNPTFLANDEDAPTNAQKDSEAKMDL